MRRYRDLSVKVKVPLVMGIASVVVFGLVCLFLSMPLRNRSVEDSSKLAQQSAISAKDQLAERINGAARVIRAYSGIVENMFETGVIPLEKKREFLISELQLLTQHEILLTDVWCIFEPNAFGGSDSYFTNKPGNSSEGVFAPSIAKGKLTTIPENLIGFLSEIPKRTEKETITEVYTEMVNGDEVKMFSVGIPIIAKGKYIGVIGTDFYTSELSDLIVSLTNKNHRFRIATDKGIIALHADQARIGAQVDRGDPETLKRILEGKLFEGFGLFDGNEVYKIFVPIHLLNENIKPWFFALNIPSEEVYENARKMIFYLLIYCIFGVILIVAVGWFLVVPILKDVSDVTQIIDTLSLGNINLQIDDNKAKDEIGRMKSKLQQLIQGLKDIADFAHNIGKGNLNAEYHLLSDDDVLGNSLLEMRVSLQNAEKEQTLRTKEEEQRNWGTAGLAKFAEILRRDNNDMEALSYNIISNLVKYLGINQGGIFVMNEAEREDDRFLEMKGCFAYDRKKFVNKQIRPGEGLVGTCYLEGELIYLTDVPNSYITITSGLGNANPKAILICPLKVNDQIFGVIELASFAEFEPYQLDFVQKVSESIASTISTVNVNIRTSRLLAQTKLQTEEMANQEEELRQNMEEMQATQEEARRREVELQDTLAKIKEVQAAGAEKEHEMQQFHNGIFATNNVVEFSKEGIVTNVNQNLCNLFGLDRSVFIGNHMSVFNGEEVYNQIMRHLTAGKLFENVNEVNANGKILTIRQKFLPIISRDGQLERAMLLAFHDQEADLRKNRDE